MARACKPACWRAWFGAPRVWLSGPRVHRGSRRPSFGFLHPSLCASSLRRSYMTTQTCKHTPIRLAFHYTPHSSTKTHEGATPTLWPLWSHIPSPAGDLIRVLFHAGSISRFTYSPFLLSVFSVYIISCILAPTHPSPGLLISRCHQRFVQGEAGKRRPRGPRTHLR